MINRQWIAAAWMLVLMLCPGCFIRDDSRVGPWHGIPVSLDEVPPSVMADREFPVETKVERYESGAYRFEFPDGSNTVIGPDGKVLGCTI